MPTPHRSFLSSVCVSLVVLASFAAACNVDDDAPAASTEASETGGSDETAECLATVEQVQPMCMLPQQLLVSWGDASIVLDDDPEARIPIGANGWLVQVPSADHYVGSHHVEGEACSAGCGWCQPGQSLCQVRFDDGASGCTLCLPWDTENPEAQCAELVEACNGAAADDTDAGETGAGDTDSDTGQGDAGDGGTGPDAGHDADADAGDGDTRSSDTGSTGADTGDSDEDATSGTSIGEGLDETGSDER